MYELAAGARAALSQAEEDPGWQGPAREAPPPPAAQLRSLFDGLGEVEDYRCARGQRYSLRTVLTLAIAARLAGYRGVTAFAEFAALLDQQQRREVDCFFRPSQQCYTTPSITTFHNILARLPPETLERAITAWAQQQKGQVLREEGNTKPSKAAGEDVPAAGETPVQPPLLAGIAMDGKDVRGASRQTAVGRGMLVAAVEHGSGLVLGQVEVGSRTNEMPAVRELAGRLELQGRVVTCDALHAQQATTRLLRQESQAHYLVTSVKGNQPTILDDLQHIYFGASPDHETLDGDHGRIERRRYWVQDLADPAWNGYADLHGRRQAIRIERQTWHRKTDKTTLAVCYALTSLSVEEATPAQLAALIRQHWHSENRLHSVRDCTYDEDRCRVAVRHLPRNLACLTNVAISLIRCQSPFEGIPTANRHYAARPQSALNLLLHPPSA